MRASWTQNWKIQQLSIGKSDGQRFTAQLHEQIASILHLVISANGELFVFVGK
jgi:hypothetical protein